MPDPRPEEEILEYIPVDAVKAFVDKDCFENKHAWEDDEYLKEIYPVQYVIKQLLNSIKIKTEPQCQKNNLNK